MKHYFAPTPDAEHAPLSISFTVKGADVTCETDSAVFSRRRLDPGSALLLSALPALGGVVADVGCGWGALGVTVALLNPGARVIMLDINERAVALAQLNAARNGASNAEARVSDGLSAYEGALDCVITNPPIRAGKRVVYGMFEQAASKLMPGCKLYAVMRRAQGADSAKAYLAELFGGCEVVERSAGYHVLRAQK